MWDNCPTFHGLCACDCEGEQNSLGQSFLWLFLLIDRFEIKIASRDKGGHPTSFESKIETDHTTVLLKLTREVGHADNWASMSVC